MRGTLSRRTFAALLALLLGFCTSGCGDASDAELLVAFSGDGQAYIEPCG